jgi:hypothetical protein
MRDAGVRAAVAAVAVVGVLLAPSTSTSAVAVDRTASVEADDRGDAYVGTGGLILPPGVDQSIRWSVAACRDCVWRVTSPCSDSSLGNAFDEQPTCRGMSRGCPDGSMKQVWFRPVSGVWRDLGFMCLRDKPTTVADVAQQIRGRLVHHLPALAPAHLPERGIVTQIPVILSAGQPEGPLSFAWNVMGEPVRVSAMPRWRWSFPDGTFLNVDESGRLAPTGGIDHVFRRPGTMLVTCATTWLGEFTVAGLGPFPVGEPIHQTASVQLAVGEGRALLAP